MVNFTFPTLAVSHLEFLCICSRIKGLIGESTVALGGKSDESDKYIEPTVLRDVKVTDPAMKDEV